MVAKNSTRATARELIEDAYGVVQGLRESAALTDAPVLRARFLQAADLVERMAKHVVDTDRATSGARVRT